MLSMLLAFDVVLLITYYVDRAHKRRLMRMRIRRVILNARLSNYR